MKKYRIALISDLHVGSKARGLDLCPHPLTDEEKVVRNSDYIAAFELWATEHVKSSEELIDVLCVTGDISDRAHADEFKYADKAVNRVAKALRIPEDRVFFVPGNHDVNWPVMKVEPTSFWSRHRYAPLLQHELTFHKRAAQATTGSFDSPPYFVAWEDADLIVVGINSAAYDGPTVEPHNGVIKQETVEQLEKYFGALGVPDGRLRICLLHHHLEQYSEPIPDTADHSIAVNAENLVKVLSANHVDILLHGHKHYPRLTTKQPDNQHPFISICAGSFSALLGIYHEGIPNQFHVVNIEGRETASTKIYGNVESWSFQSGKWKASSGVAGMYAKEAFGSTATPNEIKGAIISSMTERLKGQQFVEWQQMVQDHPQLAQVRTDPAFTALEEACVELGCELAGDKQVTTNRKWVAFRRQP